MSRSYLSFSLLLAVICLPVIVTSQVSYTNRGTDFWVGYQRTNGFSSGNTQEMVIYMGAGAQQANVTITITGNSGTPWVRNYVVPANSAIRSDFIPKTGLNNSTLAAAGLFENFAIHISSDVPIVAYAHIYENTNSGATMLLPSNVWGNEYYTMNNRQNYTAQSHTVFHIVAKEDSTWVEINPSKNTTHGWTPNGGSQPNGSYLVKLNKGDVYQVLGAIISGAEGFDLTGSFIRSVPNAQGVVNTIAVYSGSTRTSIGCGTAIGSSGDLIIQQMFPYQFWGTKYATVPFSVSTNLALSMTSIYRVMVKDITTVVKRNGVVLPAASLISGSYYQLESNTADYIQSDKPVIVAQYMPSSNACPNMTGDGDPEMFLLTPTVGAIPQAAFYRATSQAINSTYLTLVIPTPGLTTLKVDGVLFNNIPAAQVYSYAHPNFPGYSVVTKKFTAGAGQSYVESNYAFTGYTYGLGQVESYGYNLGIQIDSVNVQSVKYNTIKGQVFLDNNKNGIREFNEPLYPFVKLQTARPGIDTFNIHTYTGDFSMTVDSGTYVTSAIPFSPYYSAVPASYTSYFPAYFASDSIGFAIQPNISARDMTVAIAANGPARPGFPANYKILYANKGTDTADVQIALAKNSLLSFVSSSVTPASVTADTIKWNIASLMPAQGGVIDLKLQLATPPSINNGDTLRFKAIITSDKTDLAPVDNIFPLAQRVTGSYDPNDKVENHGGQVYKSALNNNEPLNYTIRFQNTGTDTAFNIVIRDTLNTKLDWSTLKMIGASHNYHLAVNDGICAWSFNDIKLVDSNKNEPLSHGYIAFSVQARSSVNVGDVITNKASIYFDHNLPIVTNAESTTVVQEVLPVTLIQFNATKKTGHNLLEWLTAQQVNFSHFEIERSENAIEFHMTGKVNAGGEYYSFVDNNFRKVINYYRLKMVDKDGKFRYSPVRRINNSGETDITIYPNPAADVLNLRIESSQAKTAQLQLLTVDGRSLQLQKLQVPAGIMITPVDITSLKPGLYIIKLAIAGETPVVLKFTKQ